jgi:archaellum biogenesis ATPase FlaH
MVSKLLITSVEELQDSIVSTIKSFKGKMGIFISLNKTQKSTEEILLKSGIDTSKIFFIDCVAKENLREDVLHIPPEDLMMLSTAIQEFIKDIPGDKFVIIDALSTLLIYNGENKVAKFVKEVTEFSSEKGVYVVSFSPKTQGEELLDKIFNFFDNVEKK